MVAILMLATMPVVAQQKGPVTVASQALPVSVKAGQYQIVNAVLDIPPGAGIPKHVHGGPVAVSVLSGQLTVTDRLGTRVVKAGQGWTEQTGYVHSVVNKGQQNVRVAASFLLPKGAALTTMVK
ncbi:MAG: cupin domain-containing protein [Candidatus Eremiobacteraeota bacterium]|nr:cupin domain-containing protein [Candidatus Eremiobacteraeota bacterium]